MDQSSFQSGTVFSSSSGKVLVGWGKRVWLEKPVPNQLCFYFPDFFLQSVKPWCIHEHWEEISIHECISSIHVNFAPTLNWSAPNFKHFKEMFQDLQVCLQTEELKKGVPFSVQSAKGMMDMHRLKHCLMNALQYASKNRVHLYGFWEHGEGILGATPEILFSIKDQVLESAAVAGTTRLETNDLDFLRDPKENEEHQFVVEELQQSLAYFGQVRVNQKQILRLANLSHLYTRFEVDLKKRAHFEEIVKQLHPTPALGAYPRSAALKWMSSFEQAINRKRFGAPVGYVLGEVAKCFVAIRNIQWSLEQIEIFAGCGVVKQSIFDLEWSEILLKMESIRKVFSI